MGGVLEGLIVPEDAAMPGSAAVVMAVPLAVAGLRLVPLTDRLKSSLRAGRPADARVEGFYELTEAIAGLAADLSTAGRVLYVHSEFHGGEGLQAVLGWERAAVTFGPLFTVTPHETAEDWYAVACGEETAINTGLRWLGVHARPPTIDEFSAAGLDRHRWTEEWTASPP
jgi:hypothetical protein